MRFFITGIGGFAARHLAELLLERGHVVSGLAHRPDLPDGLRRLSRRFGGFDLDAIAVGDVQNSPVLADAIARFRPDGVFHLAAQSSVGSGEAQAPTTFAVNALGTLQVLTAARAAASACRVLVVSSGEGYGRSATETPLGESTPLRPLTIYGASKAAAELLVNQAVDGYRTDAVCVRAFNQTGPGQSARFVCADFARQVVSIERGKAASISVGNLDVVRDFIDVRDAVRAYLCVWERGGRGAVYNVASGVGRRIGAILDDLRGRVRCPIRVEVDPARLRPVDLPVLVGDNTAARSLGWRPEHPWERTVDALIEDWRARVP